MLAVRCVRRNCGIRCDSVRFPAVGNVRGRRGFHHGGHGGHGGEVAKGSEGTRRNHAKKKRALRFGWIGLRPMLAARVHGRDAHATGEGLLLCTCQRLTLIQVTNRRRGPYWECTVVTGACQEKNAAIVRMSFWVDGEGWAVSVAKGRPCWGR